MTESSQKHADLIPRLIVAIVGIPALLTAAMIGPNWGLWVIVGGAGLIGAHEALSMNLGTKFGAGGWITLFGIGMVLSALYWTKGGTLAFGATFVTLVTVMCTEMLGGRPMEKTLRRVQSEIFALVYISIFFGGYLLLFRHAPRGQTWEFQDGWFLFPMFVIWAGDTAAYFAGKKWGKHKLAPAVSPGKSWEGAIGGVVGSVISGYIAWALFLTDVMSPLVVLLYAIPAAILGQLGDLSESMIKRGNDVKDSGTILYGHGGMLDRVDGLVVAVPYILLLRAFLQWLG